jgi:hypothetical protein
MKNRSFTLGPIFHLSTKYRHQLDFMTLSLDSKLFDWHKGRFSHLAENQFTGKWRN